VFFVCSTVSKQLKNATIKTIRVIYIVGAVGDSASLLGFLSKARIETDVSME
jgi:hypothetical protein